MQIRMRMRMRIRLFRRCLLLLLLLQHQEAEPTAPRPLRPTTTTTTTKIIRKRISFRRWSFPNLFFPMFHLPVLIGCCDGAPIDSAEHRIVLWYSWRHWALPLLLQQTVLKMDIMVLPIWFRWRRDIGGTTAKNLTTKWNGDDRRRRRLPTVSFTPLEARGTKLPVDWSKPGLLGHHPRRVWVWCHRSPRHLRQTLLRLLLLLLITTITTTTVTTTMELLP
mmetsp:Transcript_21249/g.46383  ORF Transcript_21249/g.46383 Transcript_21249/m.46383 type:complete len:221 (-) Transcript_21249:385-1047(-)